MYTYHWVGSGTVCPRNELWARVDNSWSSSWKTWCSLPWLYPDSEGSVDIHNDSCTCTYIWNQVMRITVTYTNIWNLVMSRNTCIPVIDLYEYKYTYMYDRHILRYCMEHQIERRGRIVELLQSFLWSIITHTNVNTLPCVYVMLMSLLFRHFHQTWNVSVCSQLSENLSAEEIAITNHTTSTTIVLCAH